MSENMAIPVAFKKLIDLQEMKATGNVSFMVASRPNRAFESSITMNSCLPTSLSIYNFIVTPNTIAPSPTKWTKFVHPKHQKWWP